jgi:hypothetical protein
VGDSARGAENVRFEEPHVPCPVSRETGCKRHRKPHILSPVLWGTVHERQRTACSLSCLTGKGMQGAENVWFFVLCAVLWGTVRKRVHDGKRMCGSKNRTFSLLSCGVEYTTGRECAARRTAHSPSSFVGDLLWERVHERWREHAARRTAHCKCEVLRASCLRTADWYTATVRFLEPHICVPLTGYCKRGFLEPHVYVPLTAYCKHEVLRASHMRTADWALQM